MNEHCMHQMIERVDDECFLLTWSISKTSLIYDLETQQTMNFEMDNKNNCFASLHGFKRGIEFSLATHARRMTCSFSMFTSSGTLIFSNTLKEPTKKDYNSSSSRFLNYYDLMVLNDDDECYQKLKQQRNDGLILICRIILHSEEFSLDSVEKSGKSSDSSNYMKGLADSLKNASESLLKEKVTLQVGDETETVNKAVLCARSSVFANIFESNTEQLKENVVTISDITMPVLKVLISFLYTGKLPHSDSMESNCAYDVDSLCDIYLAANKYGIAELCHICVNLLLPRISIENIFRVSKFAFANPDERLKSTVKTLIASNIAALVGKPEWKDFMNDEPQIVVEALTFFDI